METKTILFYLTIIKLHQWLSLITSTDLVSTLTKLCRKYENNSVREFREKRHRRD